MMQAGGSGDEEWSYRDEASLYDHIARSTSGARCGRPDTVMQGLREAYVLIFNRGRQDEGVYTLQGRAERASQYVLAFERTDDADRFAMLLQAEGFDGAVTSVWDYQQLE